MPISMMSVVEFLSVADKIQYIFALFELPESAFWYLDILIKDCYTLSVNIQVEAKYQLDPPKTNFVI